MSYTPEEKAAAERKEMPPCIHPVTGEVYYGGEDGGLEIEDEHPFIFKPEFVSKAVWT